MEMPMPCQEDLANSVGIKNASESGNEVQGSTATWGVKEGTEY